MGAVFRQRNEGESWVLFPAAYASSHAFLSSDSMDIRNEWNANRQKNRWVMQRDQHAPIYKLEQYFKTKIVT